MIITNEYELAEMVAKTIEEADLGIFEDESNRNVFIGRIPQQSVDNANGGEWSVSVIGGEPYGGNLASPKTLNQVLVAYHSDDADNIYKAGSILKKLLIDLPVEYENVLRVQVSALNDEDIVEAEQRRGTWSLSILTIDPEWI